MSRALALKIASEEGQRPPASDAPVSDLRFRALLGDCAWQQLPHQVRRRFEKCLATGDVVLYRGHVVSTDMSWLGRVLSWLTRPIGAPLPTMNGATGPAVVAVTEDRALGGQRWLRIYERPGRKPQMIQSTKRFRGETGLEEYVGAGISMQLVLSVENRALVFRSRRYLFEVGRLRFPIPALLSPGAMAIVHTQEGDGSFSFRLTLRHAVFGELLHQLALFRDV
ncbi:MAG: DUF4166 domain-containing protein [Hyphomicrobiaceae bacterium]|nr:DUF4166 domain-containing protein [Hyphomicrobiaceae bacterium]